MHSLWLNCKMLDKPECICYILNSLVNPAQSLDIIRAQSGSICVNDFQLVCSDEVGKLFCGSCPSWLSIASQVGQVECIRQFINGGSGCLEGGDCKTSPEAGILGTG